MNQKQRLRAAIDALYRNPADIRALAKAMIVLDQSQKRPPLGVADGTVSASLWARRATLIRAFSTIQEERQALDDTEDS